MIHLDTSAMVGALAGPQLLLPAVMNTIDSDQGLGWCSIVVYEWLRGPRTPMELQGQRILFPFESALPFEAEDAEIAAKLYRSVRRPRTREADLAIAACAIRRDAVLWTLNPADFADIPGLKLYHPKV